MVLNQGQKQRIEYYLNRMQLIHLDLRDEVADHMMSAIENKMINGISFEVAFEEEAQKWKKDLDNYASYWLGLLWSGPRIVIAKCVKKLKKIYLKTVIITALVLGLSFVFKDQISLSFLNILDKIIGSTYMIFFLYLLYLKFRIKRTGYKTSYSFLFIVNAVSFSLILVLYNPLITNFLKLSKDGMLDMLSLAIHSLTLAFAYFFYEFFKAHMNFQKLKTV